MIGYNIEGYVGLNKLGPDLSNIHTIFQKKAAQICYKYWIKCTQKNIFRALKASNWEGFRALKASNLERFRALKPSNLEGFRTLKPSNLVVGF